MRDDSTPTAGDPSPGPSRRAAERDADPHVNLAGELAVERTELALERTHLAWIRTVFTLLTAGVALDRGMEIIHQARLFAGSGEVFEPRGGGIADSTALTWLTERSLRRERWPVWSQRTLKEPIDTYRRRGHAAE